MSGFFDFTGDSPWGGCLEDEDAPGGGGGKNLAINPSIDLDCIFDDDDALVDEQEAVFGEDGAISSTIDDQWSKLTSMYLDLTVDDDDEAPKPAKHQAAVAPARTVIPALPTATFFSPTKGSAASTTQVEELWNSPSPVPPVAGLPPGFEAAKPKAAISVDQLEQQLQAAAAPAAPAAPSSVLTLDDIESKLLVSNKPGGDGQAMSLEELEARLIQPSASSTPQFVPVPGCDSRTIVEEDDQEGVDLPSQFAQLPYYSRVEVDREFMSAADMNYILKVQRVTLANLPNLYADDFYFQNYTRHRESQHADGSGSGETVLLVDHFPLCQLALPPVPPKAPVDFTGVLGKIPPSSLRGPREVLQLADEQAALSQPSKPGQLPSQPILPRNLGAFGKYSTLMVLENALSLVIEVEDLDILLAKPNLSADKTRKLTLKRATRTQRIFQMLRVYTPQAQQQQQQQQQNASGYCFREDSLFFQLIGRAKGRELAGRALTILPLREVFALIMVLVRNWDHTLRLLSQTDAASRLMVTRLLAKIQALTVPSLASILHVFLAAYYSRFAYVAVQPLSASLLAAIVQRAADIHRKEAEPDVDPSQRSHPLHWHAFSRVFSQLCMCVSVSVSQLVGDPRAGPPEKWDLLEAVLSSAHPSQKHEIVGLITNAVGGEILSNPPAGLARLFRL